MHKMNNTFRDMESRHAIIESTSEQPSCTAIRINTQEETIAYAVL
jgi:hypothetical protein